MVSLARLLWVSLVVVVPGGLVLLVGYLLARVMRQSWEHEREAVASERLRKAFAAVHLRALWREARAVL
ncbi:MAG: hypothetical protein ACYC8T_01805 [Myxococcaceae bacterium]